MRHFSGQFLRSVFICGFMIVLLLEGKPVVANKTSETIFTESIRKYLLKDYKSAAKDLEKIYIINKNNEKYKNWYYKSLIKAGDAEYDKRNYDAAKDYYIAAIGVTKQSIQVQSRLSAIAEINKNIKLEKQKSKKAIKNIYLYMIIGGGILLILLVFLSAYSVYIKKMYTSKTRPAQKQLIALPDPGDPNQHQYGLSWESINKNTDSLSSDMKYDILDIIKKRVESSEKVGLVDSLQLLSQFTTDSKAEINHQSSKLMQDISGLIIDDRQQTSLFTQLALMVDTKTGRPGHSFRVAHKAHQIAQSLDEPDLSSSLVYKAALLHDIGFLEILGHVVHEDVNALKEILKKRNKTTYEAVDVLRTHPQRGIKLLQYTELPQQLLDGILFHHEHFDGSGYPFGLAGDDIPLIANIIAAAEIAEIDVINENMKINGKYIKHELVCSSKENIIKPQILNFI